MINSKARVIALYLPQFHPIPENDKYWGKGFTEWTNVAKAKPLFRGHDQPRIPADLGFYDLRLPQVRKAQADLAREAGIEGFCYWHYWFGNGKEVLEMPFDEVVKSGEPDFPFCLGWALHDWTTKSWKVEDKTFVDNIIFKQEFPGTEDHINHFYRLLPAFRDHRYITVDGKLLFVMHTPDALPNPQEFINIWNQLAKENGLSGFHFVAVVDSMPVINSSNIRDLEKSVDANVDRMLASGFDAIETTNQKYAEIKAAGRVGKVFHAFMRRLKPGIILERYDYGTIIRNFYTPTDRRENVYPQILVGWDRSPRSGRKAIIYYNDTPEMFRIAVKNALKCISAKSDEHKILFLNSWNEWGEGAYIEPDLRYGRAKIEILREELQ